MKLGRLVENWKEAWKWFSVQLAVLIAAANEVYAQVEVMKEYIPPNVFHRAMLILGLLVIVSRVVKQGK